MNKAERQQWRANHEAMQSVIVGGKLALAIIETVQAEMIDLVEKLVKRSDDLQELLDAQVGPAEAPQETREGFCAFMPQEDGG